MSVVILQHVASENAGTILDFLNEKGIPYQEVRLFESGCRLPNLDEARALVVMGGPMNVYEEDKFPFLKEENRYIQEAVKRKIPYLGVCLGSQLLAKALGTRVYRAAQPEIGWGDIDLLAAAKRDRIFSALPGKMLRVLQWHEDTFDLPAGSTHLASSRVVPNQAYGVDDLFYGFQFHVEVDRPMLENWFAKRQDLREILAGYDTYRTDLKQITDSLYGRFFK